MPIRGLTERPTIPRLGKIRLGDKDPQRGFPRNQPFFVVPEEVAEALGDTEPAELHVVFLSDDLDQVASQYYRAYNATSGLICRGDGRTADALMDGDVLAGNGGVIEINAWAHGATSGRAQGTRTYVRKQITCAGSGVDGETPCPMFAAKKCAIRSFMQFAIRDVPGLGVYQLDTGSVINIRNINGTIELARAMLGGVARIPMILRRTQLTVNPDGVQKKVWGVELLVDTEYSLANLIELRRDPRPLALLPPVDETEVYEQPDDDNVIDAPSQLAPPHIAPPPAKATDAHRVEIANLKDAIEAQEGGKARVSACWAWGGVTFPYAVSDGRFVSLDLREDDAVRFILRLRYIRDGAKEHEHEPAFTADGVYSCSVCAEALQDDAAPAAAQASMLT